MNAMHIYIYHYISIVILSKGLNPQISTPKLSIVFACLEISPDWHHGGWCVPVPLSAQLRPCHQSRGGEAGTMVQPLALVSAHRPRLHWRPVDAGHWTLAQPPPHLNSVREQRDTRDRQNGALPFTFEYSFIWLYYEWVQLRTGTKHSSTCL